VNGTVAPSANSVAVARTCAGPIASSCAVRTTCCSIIESRESGARVQAEEGAAGDGVPVRHDAGSLGDDVEVAPAAGNGMGALVRRRSSAAIHQVHRLSRAVDRKAGRNPTQRALLERGLLASRDRVPDVAKRRGAERLRGAQQRFGARDRILHMLTFAQQSGPSAWDLGSGELDQGVDAGARDARRDDAVVRPDQSVNGQLVQRARPLLPLVVQERAGHLNGAAARDKYVRDRPIVAAGSAHAGHVPRVDDRALRWSEKAAVQRGRAVRIQARSVRVRHLEVAQHPLALAAAAAEAPAAAHDKTTLDLDGFPTAWYRRAGNDSARAALEYFAYALVGQAQGHQLADGVVGQIPTRRAVGFGDELRGAQKGQQVDLQAA